MSHEKHAVIHNAAVNQFEIHRMLDTGAPRAFEGKGAGAQLAHAVLERARTAGLQVGPLCSFAAGYMRRHPGYELRQRE